MGATAGLGNRSNLHTLRIEFTTLAPYLSQFGPSLSHLVPIFPPGSSASWVVDWHVSLPPRLNAWLTSG
jgi:hypothetical protein